MTTTPETVDTGQPATTTDGPGTAPSRSRWHRRIPVIAAIAVLVGGALVLGLSETPTSNVRFAPDNPSPRGAMAAAEILRAQGVEIQPANRAADALHLAESGTTLLVASASNLDPDLVAALADVEADLVLADIGYMTGLDRLTDQVELAPSSSTDVLVAECENPHAQAAGRITHSDESVRALGEDVEVCFPMDDSGDVGAFATWEQDDRRISILADFSLATNEHLDQQGNAALTLRLLGQNETLVWWVPAPGDSLTEETASDFLLMPPQARYVGLHLLVVALVLVLSAGRRMGRVVTEPLPVVVRAAETTLGRGSLYRRSRDHAHAAAALRAGTTRRLARTLGLPRSADAATVIAEISRATGRPEDQVGLLLHGPPPGSDAALTMLTRELDILESEVHRT